MATRGLAAAFAAQPGLPRLVVCRRAAHRHREALPLRNTVIIFARAPRLGAVKRRLAHGIGATAALRFYRQVLFRLLRGLARDQRFHTVVAVTPDRSPGRWPVPRIGQGHGDLGTRMTRAAARFRGRVAILGSDIPDAGPADAAAAFAALGRADAVFGPALDGGYWLVAMGPRRPAAPFARVRWSTEHALADTLSNFRHRTARLRTLRDIDTAADLAAWRSGDRRSGNRAMSR